MPDGPTGIGSSGTRTSAITAEEWRVFAIEHRQHGNVTRAARAAGISVKTAYRAVNEETHYPLYRRARLLAAELVPIGAKTRDELSPEALRAVEDFGYFRERYFGRVATPWATHTAKVVADLLATPHKEFVLVNEPPGVGKSTFWTLDLPAWMICRDRAIRIQIGSSARSSPRSE